MPGAGRLGSERDRPTLRPCPRVRRPLTPTPWVDVHRAPQRGDRRHQGPQRYGGRGGPAGAAHPASTGRPGRRGAGPGGRRDLNLTLDWPPVHLIHQVAFRTKAVHLGEVKMRGPNGVVVDVIRYRDKMQYDRRCCRAHPARRVHRRVQDPDELRRWSTSPSGSRTTPDRRRPARGRPRASQIRIWGGVSGGRGHGGRGKQSPAVQKRAAAGGCPLLTTHDFDKPRQRRG